MKVLALLILATMTACGPSSRNPKQTLSSFLHDTTSGDIDAAYSRLSLDFRTRCSRACFIKLLEEQPGQSRLLLDELRAAEPTTVYLADAKLTSDLTLRLSKEVSATKKEAETPYLFFQNPLDFYPQNTPQQALRSFVLAYSRQRFDVLLRFVPKSLESKLTVDALKQRFTSEPKISAQVERLRQHSEAPLIVEDTIARLPLGEDQEAVLLLEEGRWRVQRLE